MSNIIPPLVCPKCMKSFDDCKDYSAYHNRVRYICPHCGYDGDSTEFQTSYKWHPIHKEQFTPMTLDEAIEHCEEKACANTECAMEHKQLAEWLKELKEYRKRYN